MTRTHAFLVALALLAVALYGREQRHRGLAEARDATRADSLVTLRVVTDSLKRQFRADTIRLTRWRTRYDTARVTLNIHDTLEVVRFVTLADSTIASCTAALSTCDLLARSLTQERDLWATRHADAIKRGRRPFTSAGLAYDARTGRLGGYVERDVLWRLRVGAVWTPDAVTGMIGVRW